jgi:ureidoglycolate lyase
LVFVRISLQGAILMYLKIENLSPESFAPFGKVIEQPIRPQDAAGPGWRWWAENVVLAGAASGDRNYAIGYLDLRPAELSFDWAERHMQSDELILPAGGDSLVYVGPPDQLEEPARLPPLDSFRVFRLRPGQGVLLGKSVWHGAPLALDTPLKVFVLLLKDTGKTDVHVVRFEPVAINPS